MLNIGFGELLIIAMILTVTPVIVVGIVLWVLFRKKSAAGSTPNDRPPS